MNLSVLIVALSILASLAVLGASIALFRSRHRHVRHPIAYRLALSALVALLCPTLVLAGHGGLPVPTVAGLTIVLVQLSSISDLEVALIGVGDSDVVVLIPPALIAFSCVLLALCTKFRNSDPRLPVWDE